MLSFYGMVKCKGGFVDGHEFNFLCCFNKHFLINEIHGLTTIQYLFIEGITRAINHDKILLR